ncbi:MAG: rod shape-determining protein RodA [Thermoanaerobacterales bacterium]|nr:rod shape-determining protein RodA [Thermoanaerobacterales bacterium]
MARTWELERLPRRDRLAPARRERGRRRDEPLFHARPPAAWRHVDLVLLCSALAVSAIGAMMVLSSTRGTDPDSYDTSYLRKQLIFIAVGIVAMVLVTLVDYRRLRDFASVIYGATLLLLVLVISPLGSERRGSQAWFQLGSFQLQPAELAKVGVIVTLAAALARAEVPLRLRVVLGALAIVGVPTALILAQPDLGSALVFVAITMGVLLIAGARPRHIVVLTALGIVAVVGVLTSDVLEDYQRDRLTTFLDADGEDLQGEAYNSDQSKAAIASGGVSGKGYLEGTQTRLGFVPEQHTDFIFTAVGEELGFVGSSTVLGLLALICFRVLRTAQIAQDRLGTLICIGVLSMLVFQIFQNVGMTMGIMPITGIPLPFMSYGGSSVLASWLALGVVLNVHMRRFG